MPLTIMQSPLHPGGGSSGGSIASSPYLDLFDLESYTKVVYIDDATGDDTNPGTVEYPYKTFDYGRTKAGNSNGAIVMGPGLYYTEYSYDSYTSSGIRFGITNSGNDATVIAAVPGQVEIYNRIDHNSKRDCPLFAYTGAGGTPKLYGLILTHNHRGGVAYQTAVFKQAEAFLYNCVVRVSDICPAEGRSIIYDPFSVRNPESHQCTWIDTHAWVRKHEGRMIYHWDSAWTHWPIDDSDRGGNIVISSYDPQDFSNPDDNSKGVYGGPFAWPT